MIKVLCLSLALLASMLILLSFLFTDIQIFENGRYDVTFTLLLLLFTLYEGYHKQTNRTVLCLKRCIEVIVLECTRVNLYGRIL